MGVHSLGGLLGNNNPGTIRAYKTIFVIPLSRDQFQELVFKEIR